MALYIYLLILISSALLFKRKFKRLINFAFIFNAIWCVFGAISTLGLFDMRIPVMEIHIYAWTFIGIVDIIILLFAKKASAPQMLRESEFARQKYSFKYVAVFQIVSLLLISVLFFNSMISLIENGNFSAIRNEFYGILYDSFYLDFLFRSLPVAMMNGLIVFYVFTAFISGEMQRLIYAAINCFIVTVCNGGRYTLILLLFAIVVCFITLNWKNKLRARQIIAYSKIIIWLTIFVVLSLVVITFIRNQDLSNNIVFYYSGSLSFLDRILENKELFGFDEGLMYGYMTFGAFCEPVVLFIKAVFNTDIDVPSYHFNIYCQEFYNISTGEPLRINNNTSVLYYFLRDFGAIGIVIGAVFLGTLLVISYNNMRKNKLFSGLFFVYFANVMFNTLMTYQFFGNAPIVIVFTLFMCSRQGESRGKTEFR